MATILPGPLLKVSFHEEERGDILKVARERQAIGADYRNNLHPYLDGEAKSLNAVGNHITGELTERAVEAWLLTEGVACTRPTSLKDELENKLPDITTMPIGITIDVKSKTKWSGGFLTRADQDKKDAPTLAVLWCKPYRPIWQFNNYDTFVPVWAEILGWVAMAEASDPLLSKIQDKGHRFVHESRLRSPLRLLEWVQTGILPPHP
jgi:hypothetical protein